MAIANCSRVAVGETVFPPRIRAEEVDNSIEDIIYLLQVCERNPFKDGYEWLRFDHRVDDFDRDIDGFPFPRSEISLF